MQTQVQQKYEVFEDDHKIAKELISQYNTAHFQRFKQVAARFMFRPDPILSLDGLIFELSTAGQIQEPTILAEALYDAYTSGCSSTDIITGRTFDKNLAGRLLWTCILDSEFLLKEPEKSSFRKQYKDYFEMYEEKKGAKSKEQALEARLGSLFPLYDAHSKKNSTLGLKNQQILKKGNSLRAA